MRTKSKIILLGLLTIMILFIITSTTAFCAQLSEKISTWTRLEGAINKSSAGNDLAIDKDGNSYMVGHIIGKNAAKGFVNKYAVDGSKLWTRKIKNNVKKNISAEAVALDSVGNCYVACSNNTKKINSFLVKYNPDGTEKWFKIIKTHHAWTYIYDLAIDKSDNLYITGFIGSKLDNNDIPNKTDLFITKYNSAGIHQWTRLLGDAKANTYGIGIAIDNHTNIYVTGETDNSLDGQNIKIPVDGLVVKYDSNGNKKWARLFGATVDNGESYYAKGKSIALDSHGNCFISGDTNGQIDGKPRIGYIDSFIITYTPDGNKIWSKLIGVKETDTFNNGGIVIDSLNNFYLSVVTDSAGQTNLLDYRNNFLIKYNANTEEEWRKQFKIAKGTISIHKINIDKNNFFYTVGSTYVALEGEPKIGLEDAFITTYFNK